MTIYDFNVLDSSKNIVSLEIYRGKVLLIVNTATHCGFTPQYEVLESLYKKYKDQGFEILDFPSNQFLEQAPGNDEEINQFCSLNYGTTFDRFSKIDVNGKNADPLYVYLKQQPAKESENDETSKFKKVLEDLKQIVEGNDIKWNFTKFLIDKKGNVVSRFSPTIKPEDIAKHIEKLL